MSTIPTTIASTIDVEAFKIRTPGDQAPDLVWDESREVHIHRSASMGTYDAKLTVVFNVDDGQWDFVIPDLYGFDKIAAIDRAIHVLTECRIALLATGSDTTGKCLTRDADGYECSASGRHDTHDYRDDRSRS